MHTVAVRIMHAVEVAAPYYTILAVHLNDYSSLPHNSSL